MIVEICCGSYEDCLRAERGGAKRVELNSALFLGGLTPSIATVKKVLENTSLEVIAMVRPRGAGFCYLESEVEVMMQDAEEMLKLGVDGLAFGFLNADCTVDVEKTKAMVDLIHRYGKTAVYHRAIDCAVDYEVSVCTFPAYESTEVEARAKEAHGNALEAWRESMRSRLTEGENTDKEGC